MANKIAIKHYIFITPEMVDIYIIVDYIYIMLYVI